MIHIRRQISATFVPLLSQRLWLECVGSHSVARTLKEYGHEVNSFLHNLFGQLLNPIGTTTSIAEAIAEALEGLLCDLFL